MSKHQGFTDSYGQTLAGDAQPAPANQGGGSAPGLSFPGITIPSNDMEAVRDGRRNLFFYYDVDLSTARDQAAGTQAIIPIPANFLYIDQRLGSGVATLHFQDINGKATPVTMFPGALWRVPFTQVGIENTAQAGASLRIIYGMDVDALPISAAGVTVLNPVSILDTGLARSVAGLGYMGSVDIGGVAAQFTYIQLMNPAGSARRLVVREVSAGGTVAKLISLGFNTAALANLSAAPKSKRVAAGATVTVAELRYTNDAGSLLTGAFANLFVPANSIGNFSFFDPIEIEPGNAIVVRDIAVNQELLVNFDYSEAPFP